MQLSQTAAHGHHSARLNRLIQLALITGLSVSMALMLAGAILYALHGQSAGAAAISMHSLLAGVAAGSPIALMVAGVIVLMVTPALRVVVAAIGYMLDRDWIFALVSLGVLLVLIASMLIGNG